MRAVSIELSTPSPVEPCGPRGGCFADTLKATMQETDQATPEGDVAPTNQGDFEAAIALLGALTTPLCGMSPPPDAPGLPRPPAAIVEQPALPDTPQPGPTVGDQRILPTVGEMPPTAPPLVVRPNGDDMIPPPTPAPVPVQPSPIGDARVPVTPIPAPAAVVPPVVAEVALPPTDLTQTNDEPIENADGVTGKWSASSVAVASQPSETVVAKPPAANAHNESQEAARSPDAPTIDVATHDRSRPIGLRGDDAVATDAGATVPNEAIAAVQSAATGKATNEAVGKTARSLAQLPAVLSDLAQQARTESSPRRVVIPLDPPALGHVTVEIIVRADSVKVSLQHADEATFNSLNAQRPAIEAALESNGLHLSGFDVSGHQRQRPSHTRMAARHFEALVEQIEPDGALRL